MLGTSGSVNRAEAAIKEEATNRPVNPLDGDKVVYIGKATQKTIEQRRENQPKLASLEEVVVAESAAMREVKKIAKKAAASQATVLIYGESGTGKELISKMVHQQSDRSDKPFVVIDCGSIPENLLESELFGYEQGAFTGAAKRKPGRVEIAEGGTIFLDEIGDLPMAFQGKLLRLLQEREYQPLGATRSHQANVRFVAATHRDLKAMVANGSFRLDLYYRLSVVQIWVPPLRERREDIAPLVHKAVKTFCQDNCRVGLSISSEAVAQLIKRPWFGNVRELQNVLESLAVLAEGDEITLSDLEREFLHHRPTPSEQPSDNHRGDAKLKACRSNIEQKVVIQALERASGNRSLAARLLGISRRTLYNKMAEFNLSQTTVSR